MQSTGGVPTMHLGWKCYHQSNESVIVVLGHLGPTGNAARSCCALGSNEGSSADATERTGVDSGGAGTRVGAGAGAGAGGGVVSGAGSGVTRTGWGSGAGSNEELFLVADGGTDSEMISLPLSPISLITVSTLRAKAASSSLSASQNPYHLRTGCASVHACHSDR